jgi:outer membrane lipoprotein-sorting protein
MNPLQHLAWAALALLAPLAGAEMPSIDWDLDDAIRQIDGQARDFESAMARVEISRRGADGAVLGSEIGNAFLRENGDLRISIDDGSRVIYLDGSRVYVHEPEASRVTEYSTSRGGDRLEPFYRLGFSESGADMNRGYLVTILGEEEISDARTLLLELTPERDRDRAVVGKIRLWIDQASWMPRRQEFSVTGDRTVVTLDYTDVARNLKLNPELFSHRWPRGTERVRN